MPRRVSASPEHQTLLLRLSAINAAIAEGLPREAVFDRILESVQLLGFDRVRLDLLSADSSCVEPAAACGFGGKGLGGPVPVKEDTELEILFADVRPHILPCECDYPDAGPSERGCIPVLLQGEVVGKISVDNARSRSPLTKERLDEALHFAHQVALALLPNRESSDALRRREELARSMFAGDAKLWAKPLETLQETTLKKLERLERLAEATREMMGNLEAIPLQKRLDMIARHAAEILEAETAGVFLVHDGCLVLEASFGHRPGFGPGKVPPLAIHDKKGGGLTGYIAYHRKLFTDYGESLKAREAYSHSPTHTPSEDCFSLLAIPLLKRQGQNEGLIGLLRVDNKKGEDGKAVATLRFSQEDEWILTIFAKAAMVAIEGAELVARLREESHFRERLIASSPDGIIAADDKGRVTEYNKRAEEILGFERKDVIGNSVVPLYFDENDPYVIGNTLANSAADYVLHCETAVRSETGKRIPIRHVSTSLFNAEGHRTGSVGYFEDLSLQKALERRESLLLRASNVLAEAKDLDAGLQRLVEMMVAELGRSFCGILLMDEADESLTLRAECLAENPAWRSRRQKIVLARWKGLWPLLKAGRPRMRDRSDEQVRGILERLTRLLGFKRQIETILVVPLKLDERVVGQLDLGDLEGEGKSAFSKAEIDLVSAIAKQVTILIDRFKLFEQVQRAREAAEVVARVTLLEDQGNVLESIAREIWDALGCSVVVLYKYDQDADDLILPPAMAGKIFQSDKPTVYDLVLEMVRLDKPCVLPDVSRDERFWERPFVHAQKIKSCVAIPLAAAGRKVGVLFINYRTFHRFTGDELAIFKMLADQAAVAIRNAQLFEERATKLAQQKVVAELSRELLGAKAVQEAMDWAVELAARALGVELCNIVLPDPDGLLIFSAGFGWQRELIGKFKLSPGKGSQTGYTIMMRRSVSVEDYRNTAFRVPKIVLGQSIRSGLSVPMFHGDAVVGAMLVHTRRRRHFTGDDETLLSLIANQTAIALARLRQYEENLRQKAYSEALYKASKALTAQIGLERRQILDQIVQPAMEGIVSLEGPKPVLGTVQLYNEDQDELILESVYPPWRFADLVDKIGEKRSVRAWLRERKRIGITGRTVLTGQPILAKDVRKSRDYIPYSATTRSELSVPLLDRGKVIGVLNAESDAVDAFDGDDRDALQALAELVVAAIQNTRQFEELKEARLLADTRTTLAWMGIGNAVRRHAIAGHVGGIRNDLKLLSSELRKLGITDEKIRRTLKRIERMVRSAAKMGKSISGRVDQQRNPILINKELISSWSRRFDGRRQELPVQLQLSCDLSDTATVYANVFWLKQVLDILVNNAIDATKAMSERTIVLGSRKRGAWAEVYVSDNGPGVPDEIRNKLFREPIEKPKGSKGLGMGLLIAHAVVQIYGGSMSIEYRSGGGTTIVISLPLERGT